MFNAKKGDSADKSRSESRELIAIDIGTFTIRIGVGFVHRDGQVEMTYYSEVPSRGMVGGSVANLSDLASALSELSQRFNEESGYDLNNAACIIGIAGRHIDSFNSRGNATIMGGVVSTTDRRKAIDNACTVRYKDNHHLIHGIPRDFQADSIQGITDPVGLSTPRIEVLVHLITCSVDQEKNLRAAIAKMNPRTSVKQVIFNGIAAADAVLVESEKDIGVAVVDMGEGTVNVTVYDRKQLIISFGLAFGGDRMRREIAQQFGVSLNEAEDLKYDAYAARDLIPEEKRQGYFQVTVKDSYGNVSGQIRVPLYELVGIVEDNLVDIFRAVRDRIEEAVKDAVRDDPALSNSGLNLGAGFVLTGGLSRIPGISYVASHALSNSPNGPVSVRLGAPRGVSLSAPEVDPDNKLSLSDAACVVGLLRCAGLDRDLRQKETDAAMGRKQHSGLIGSFTDRIRNWWKREFL